MTHPLVDQLRFARSEFVRCLEGVSSEDAPRRLGPMNCISWIVGHLASQENIYWVLQGLGRRLAPGLEKRVGWGQPASTPPLEEMWSTWRAVTAAADEYLDTLTTESLQMHQEWEGKVVGESIGTRLLRNTYHYWFHLGEGHATRQMLGHTGLPQFVGNMSEAAYHPEE